jgi:group I intron endonuclease
VKTFQIREIDGRFFIEEAPEEWPKGMGIYLIRNKINGKVWTGQAVNLQRRWQGHLCEFKRGINSARLQNAWDKYGYKAFEFCVLEEVSSREDLVPREIYQSWKKENGYNLEHFDRRGTRIVSEETRRRLSEKLRGKARKGHPQNDLTRKRISDSLKGRPKPEGFSAGERNPQYGKCKEQNTQWGLKWYTSPDGVSSKFKPGLEPEGWTQGRKIPNRKVEKKIPCPVCGKPMNGCNLEKHIKTHVTPNG